jgi:hypothetical protein
VPPTDPQGPAARPGALYAALEGCLDLMESVRPMEAVSRGREGRRRTLVATIDAGRWWRVMAAAKVALGRED